MARGHERKPHRVPDFVGEAIRAAARRAEPSPAAWRRCREAVHAEWQAGLRRRRLRRRVLVAAAAMAGAILAGVWFGPGPWSPARGTAAARVEVLVPPVWVLRPGAGDARATVRAEPGMKLVPGSEVSTLEGGRLSLALPTGISVRVDRNSRLRIHGSGRAVLLAGGVYVDTGSSGNGPPRAPFVLETPHGVVRHVGTQYEARLEEGGLVVRVREGRVTVHSPARAPLEVAEGQAVRIDPGGLVRREPIDPANRCWTWAAALAPAPDLEGRSLMDYLRWVSREEGLGVVFENPDLRAEAGEIRLRGRVEGVRPLASLEGVLETCGLRYRLAEGHVVVFEGRSSAEEASP